MRFDVPTGGEDKGRIELVIYQMVADASIPIFLTSTGGSAFSFAIERGHPVRLREILDGLVIPVDIGRRRRPPFGRTYLLGIGGAASGFRAQRALLENTSHLVEVHPVVAEVIENCTVVSVITDRFRGIPGIMALILKTLTDAGVPVYQTADSPYSRSVLVPEADARRATRALHDVFGLGSVAPAEPLRKSEN